MGNERSNIGEDAERFISRWSDREGGQERANYSLFLTELCDVLGVSHPDPAGASHEFNDYVFERRVEHRLPDGTIETTGRIDLYKRGHFILEAKQSRQRGNRKAIPTDQGDLFFLGGHDTNPNSGVLDHLMIQARRQAEGYRWPVDLTNEQIIERLVELNQVRASEERRGFIKWLRPNYQIEKLGPLAHRADRVQSIAIAGSSRSKSTFPAERKAQAGHVLDLLSRSREPLTVAQIASQFENQNRITSDVKDVLTSLNRLGQIETFDDGRSYVRIAS